MACNATDIPKLSLPRNEIIEIIPASYNNMANRVTVPGIPRETIPGSPEDIRIPVPSSGAMTPINIGDPRKGTASPIDGGRSPQKPGTPEPGLLVSRAFKRS